MISDLLKIGGGAIAGLAIAVALVQQSADERMGAPADKAAVPSSPNNSVNDPLATFESSEASVDPGRAELARLRDELQTADDRMVQLEFDNEVLKHEVENLRRRLSSRQDCQAPRVSPTTASESGPSIAPDITEAMLPAFDAARLQDADLAGASVGMVRDAFREMHREIAMLEAAAYNEGRGGEASLQEQILAIRHSLQDYLGPDAYLAGLYASGAPNRLVITEVKQGSDAASQGLERGDVVLRVDGYRVFDRDDLSALTAGLGPEAPVRVELLRNGTRVHSMVTDPAQALDVRAQSISPRNYYAAE